MIFRLRTLHGTIGSSPGMGGKCAFSLIRCVALRRTLLRGKGELYHYCIVVIISSLKVVQRQQIPASNPR